MKEVWNELEDAGLYEFRENSVVRNVAYLPTTPEDAFEFSVKGNECSVKSLCDKKYTEIKIPEKYQGKPVTSIGDEAFKGCVSLTSVAIPDSVTTIGANAFSLCKSLTSVAMPSGVTTIGDDAFSWCSSLTSITIPSSVTVIRSFTFNWCMNLTNVTIPFGVTTIRTSAFKGCGSLTSVTIPDSVTTIGANAFSLCKNLTSVTIPSSVTTIGVGAFGMCESLRTIVCSGNYDTLKSVFARNNANDENIFACIEQGKQYLLEYRRKRGLCSYCGGTFKKGQFSTKCINCGRKKDY